MNSKAKIAQTAFELFLSNGYKASTMAQLVEKSGLSKGAFYHYFKSKQDIYNYVLEHYFLSYYQDISWQELLDYDYKNFEIALKSYYIKFINEIKSLTNNSIANYFVMFFEAYNNNPNFKKTVQQFYKQFETVISKILIKENNISTKQAKIKAAKIIAQYEGFMFYMAVFPEKPLADYLDKEES